MSNKTSVFLSMHCSLQYVKIQRSCFQTHTEDAQHGYSCTRILTGANKGSVQPARFHTTVKIRPPLIPWPPNELVAPASTSPWHFTDESRRRVTPRHQNAWMSFIITATRRLALPRLYHLTRLANVPCQSVIAVHGRVVDGDKQHMAIVQTFNFNSWNASSRSAVNAKGLSHVAGSVPKSYGCNGTEILRGHDFNQMNVHLLKLVSNLPFP